MLPSATAALAAAGAGRWRIAGGTLHLDATARRLLGERRARLSLQRWLARRHADEAVALQAALQPDSGPALSITLAAAAGRVGLHGSRQGDGWAGVLLPVAPAVPAHTPPTPPPAASGDAFFAGVSHELRTPLNAILGFTRLAQGGNADAGTQRHLAHIAQASALMLRVVNDLLDLASLEAGKLEIEPDAPLAPAALLARVGHLAAGLRLERPIRLYTTVDPACPAQLRGDAGRIEQVLLNLVANAIKFTPRGVVVLAARLRAREGDHVTLRLSVSDTGLGIALDDLQRMGRAFERVHETARPRSAGSGLGLAVVQRLLQLHGTRLHMASVAGGGTTCWFDLVLPLDSGAPPEALQAETALFTADRRLAATVATQWRAHGQALLPAGASARAARWVVDAAAADAPARMAQARREGRELFVVSADPVGAVEHDARTGAHGTPEQHTLPLLAAAVFQAVGAGAGGGAPRGPSLDGLRVLLLEDNPMNQQVLVALLDPLGARTVVAADIRSAQRLIGREHFDVALLDIELPDGSGLDWARALRMQPAGEGLPIVFLSAHLGADDRLAAAALGALACLAKPFDPEVLQALLARVPRSAAAASAGADAAAPAVPVAAPVPMRPRIDLRSLFASHWPAQRRDIEDAADPAALQQAVHALRGSLALLGDAAALRCARTVEEGLRAGQPAAALPLAALLLHAQALASG